MKTKEYLDKPCFKCGENLDITRAKGSITKIMCINPNCELDEVFRVR